MNKYNIEKVFFCKECLSLDIRENTDKNVDECNKCKSLDIGRTNLVFWESLYKGKYGRRLLE